MYQFAEEKPFEEESPNLYSVSQSTSSAQQTPSYTSFSSLSLSLWLLKLSPTTTTTTTAQKRQQICPTSPIGVQICL